MPFAISQLSCFSSINRKLQLQRRSVAPASCRSKFLVAMHFEETGTETQSSEPKVTLRYTADPSNARTELTSNSHMASEEQLNGKTGIDEQIHDEVVSQPHKGAKIHDFCFGIPFGGLVLSGGLVGFLFSRNPTTLRIGLLYGVALLALSTFSLKIWRQGKSSLPFILGQAAISAVLLSKYVQNYSMTKKVFPTGFYAVVSAAMLCFYSYVMISGGNPPPKKKSTTHDPSMMSTPMTS